MRKIKCDGEHPDPICADPQCWLIPRPKQTLGAAWITINLDSMMVRYLVELVNADKNRMRILLEHARSRGERSLSFVENTMATELSEVLLISLSMAVAKNYPVNPAPTPWPEGAPPEDVAIFEDVVRCLKSNAREAFIDGLASALTIITPPGSDRGEPAEETRHA